MATKQEATYVHSDGVGGGFFKHDPEPHHNDRGSCAFCLYPIRKARKATK
jgi:hypothetical protein